MCHVIFSIVSISFITAFLLDNSRSQPDSIRIRCGLSAMSYMWSRSADGSENSAIMLNTSSEKYNVVDSNVLEITLTNVTGADGGLYRCIYDQGDSGTSSELCIYVYGKLLISRK